MSVTENKRPPAPEPERRLAAGLRLTSRFWHSIERGSQSGCERPKPVADRRSGRVHGRNVHPTLEVGVPQESPLGRGIHSCRFNVYLQGHAEAA
jgi:hypothetical protein